MITSQPLSFIVKSILAGMLIGCGCLAYVVIENKYIGSFLFSLGLLTIIIKEYNLYTGKVGNWIPKDTLKLLVMFLLNAFGTALVAYLFTFTRANIDAIYPLVEAKVNDNLLSIFILACGCGAMMHIACFNFAVKIIRFMSLCRLCFLSYADLSTVLPTLDSSLWQRRR